MSVSFTIRQVPAERLDVEPQVSIGIQPRRLPVRHQPAFSQLPVEGGEDATQPATCAALIVIRPDQCRQAVAAVGAALDRKIRQQRHGLAAADMKMLVI